MNNYTLIVNYPGTPDEREGLRTDGFDSTCCHGDFAELLAIKARWERKEAEVRPEYAKHYRIVARVA
jgi:hypothetical protein